VLGLKLYKEKDILKILSLLNANEEYMVMMAEAWLLATIAITYPEEVYDFLKETKDVVLKRKTISKISDSFRFDEKTKNKFKNLRNP
jgi:3-methyladenine DNA glycosylase AlkD